MSGGPPGTRCRRPGTPGQEATPSTASARSTPASTRATIAPRALATLKAPGRVTDASASTPPGPSTRNVDPSAPQRTSTACQSACGKAPDAGSAQNVTIGTDASATSRLPYRSATFTTPTAEYAGVNSFALARK